MLRILFTGGGTGGHIYPVVAVAESIKDLGVKNNQSIEMRYFGIPGDFTNVLQSAGIRVEKIIGGKLRRYADLRNLLDIPKTFFSFFQLLWKIFKYMPDVVFSKGGPGAFPVVFVSRFYRIPVMIHESDSVPGLTNQISGKISQRVGISFSSAGNYFKKNVALVGNPIRNFLLTEDISQDKAKLLFGMDANQPLILFIAGSQGATRINDFVLDILPELLKEFQVLHQSGIKNFENVKKEFAVVEKNLGPEKAKYKLMPYFEKNLKEAIVAADIIISRAGSGGIFEIANFGKPSILIPLPESAGDHQRKNAYDYASTGASMVIETDNLTPNVFMTQIRNLISNPEKMQAMSEAAKKFSKPEAAKIIAEEILKLGINH